jgi:RimK family alpha-L-glutamate ligase
MTATAPRDPVRAPVCEIALVGYPTHAVTSRLRDELVRRGHACELVHPDLVVTAVGPTGVVVHPSALRADLVVLTVSTDHLVAVHAVHQLELDGISVLNRPGPVLLSSDKALTVAALARARVPVPRTVSVGSVDTALHHGAQLGYPLVLKAADGAEGHLVRRVPQESHLADIFTDLRDVMGQTLNSRVPLLLQEMVGAGGTDRRLFVVGGSVQAAMDRRARPGEWRSNLSLGAEPDPATPTDQEIEIAERAARALELDITTIDLLAGTDGPVVVEANANGDILDVAMTSGLDLVGAMVDLMEMRAGVRRPGRVSARPLTAPDHAALTDFCVRRLDAKRRQLAHR